ncbi:MAG: imidazolonepropionase [Saprospiraceae bacterium]|nr:imidazolonepropionase [Saprospiraceae bacterium]
MATLFKNIKELIQVRKENLSFLSGAEMQILLTIKDAFLQVNDGIIMAFGPMSECPEIGSDEVIDVTGRMVLPAWCDSHTHLVYAGNREGEFVDRISGLSYEEIAGRGGGILNSAKTLQEISEEDLYEQSRSRLLEVAQMGTGAIEIKSGYGLTMEAELKMLRVIRRLKENFPLKIKATYLGAHALPLAYKDNKQVYIDLVTKEIMPEVAKQGLADFVDVFCETGYFSVEETIQVMEAGRKFGLKAKIHVNQFNAIGGVKAAVEYNALSVDHLEHMRAEDIEALKGTKTMLVALPNCSYFLSIPYTPARQIIDAGLPLALATDYNPGSAPSGNMNQVVSAACIKMKMTPEEAINAATINGAYAMGLEEEVGSITVGKIANLLLTKPISSYHFLPYSFGESQIEAVYLSGKIFTK